MEASAKDHRTFWVNIGKAILAGGLLFWLVRSGRLDLALLVRVPISLWYVLGIGFLLGSMLLQATRWWRILYSQGIYIRWQQAVQLSWMGQFFSVLLPGASGGELVRAYYISQESSATVTSGVSTVLMDRVMGLYVLIWLGTPSVWILSRTETPFAEQVREVGTLMWLLVGGMTAGFIWLLWPPTLHWLLRWVPSRFRQRLLEVIEAFKAQPRRLLEAVIFSALGSLFYLTSFYMATRTMGARVSWQVVFLIAPLITIANSLPLAPGGVGVAEATSSLLFAQFGVSQGAAIMLLLRLWIILLRLPGALVYVLYRRHETSASRLPVDSREGTSL